MAYDPNNIFANILRGEIPCTKVLETEHALAFHDIAPQAPVHVLVVPKGPYVSYEDFMTAPPALQLGFWSAVQQAAHSLQLAEKGYRIISNHGADAGQLVPHFHVHILGGKPLGALVEG